MEQPCDVVEVAFAEGGHMWYVLTFAEGIGHGTDHLCVSIVNFQFICRNQLAALSHVAYDFIHQQNDRCSEPFSQIKGSDRLVICILNGTRTDCNDRMVTVGAPLCLHDVAL